MLQAKGRRKTSVEEAPGPGRGAGWRLAAALLLALATAAAQKPPAPPRYANMPAVAVPFGRFAQPYQQWFLTPETLRVDDGATLAKAPPSGTPHTVNVGFLGPIQYTDREAPFGLSMLHGAQMAIDEANARGGYRPRAGAPGIPYALKVHNDQALWGASSNEVTDMIFRQHVWAMLGSVDGSSTHIALRVALKLDLPIVNTASSDPTLTETRVPWLLRDFPDDRQQGYALSDYIFRQQKLQRVAVVREVERYGREGVVVFGNVARRLGHPPLLDLTFHRGETDFSRQIHLLKASRAQAVVVWGGPPEVARLLRQMRAASVSLPVFGPSRLNSPQLLKLAGPAANGLVLTCALDPTRQNAKWRRFQQRYRQRFHDAPDAYAARAYDGMNILLGAIQKAGLDKGRIMQALLGWQTRTYQGVSGRSDFDHTLNDIAPVTLARVRDGRFVYLQGRPVQAAAVKPAASPQPYAVMDPAAVVYPGPGRGHGADVKRGPLTFGLFIPLHGPHQQEGEALLAGAQMAIARANRQLPPGQRRFALAVGDAASSWGLLSSRIVDAIFHDHALALITVDGATAHLCEQLANKIGLPVVTLSGDPTTTEINLPWIFRLGPGDDEQARGMAARIYQKWGLRRVALVAPDDHDGDRGTAAFLAAARSLRVPAPRVFTMRGLAALAGPRMAAAVRDFHPQAVVLWTDPEALRAVIASVPGGPPSPPVFLSGQAAGLLPLESPAVAGPTAMPAGVWTVAGEPANAGASLQQFVAQWRQSHAAAPPRLAAAADDAIRLLTAAERISGPNRARLRDQLAGQHAFAGMIAAARFDAAGNDRAPFPLQALALQSGHPSEATPASARR